MEFLCKSSYCEKNAPLAIKKAMNLFFFSVPLKLRDFFCALCSPFLIQNYPQPIHLLLFPLVSIRYSFLSHYSLGIDYVHQKINVHSGPLNARMRAAAAHDIPLNDISQLQIIEDLANVGVTSSFQSYKGLSTDYCCSFNYSCYREICKCFFWFCLT